MLILGRKVNEKVRIGPDIFVTVVRISRSDVRLGFEAPKELPIVRTELDPLERKDGEE